MFHAMLHGLVDTEGLNFEVEYHDIEELNAGVLGRGVDISKIS
jgi:1,4-dihydroxy-6-naphthoate synthase